MLKLFLGTVGDGNYYSKPPILLIVLQDHLLEFDCQLL